MKKCLIFAASAVLALCMGCVADNPETAQQPFVKILTEAVNISKDAAENQVVMIQATENTTWQAEISEGSLGWISLVKNSGIGSGRLVFSVDENIGTQVRSAVISLTGSSPSGQALDGGSLTISQLGTAPSILAVPNGVVSVPSDANSRYVMTVTANVEWKAEVEIISGEDGWASVSSPVGTASGSGEAAFAFTANETEEARTAILRVSGTGDNSDLSAELRVTQQRAPAKYGVAIAGMNGYIPEGDGYMVVLSGSKEREYDCIVAVADDTTRISFEKKLAEGEYTLVSVTPKGGSEIALGANFSVDAEGVCTLVSKWLAAFESFGGDSPESPIHISLPKHLKALADAVNGGETLAGKYLVQTADISLAEYDPWIGIGNASCRFEGSYDGGSHKISGLKISAGAPEGNCGQALFRHIGAGPDSTVVVKNFTTEGSATASAGFVAGAISLCDSNAVISGIVNKVEIEAISGSGDFSDIAGVVGCVLGGGTTVSGCVNSGMIGITSGGAAQKGSNGGVIGRANGRKTALLTVTGCSNTAPITFIGNTGGVVGQSSAGYLLITDCSNTGTVSQVVNTVSHGAGIIATAKGDSISVFRCFNAGIIGGYRHSGTIVGVASSSKSVVRDCYNCGTVKTQNATGNNGGVVGNITVDGFKVENCYNRGLYVMLDGNLAETTVGNNTFGGVSGSGNKYFSGVSNCFYLSGKGMVGGLSTAGSKGVATDVAGKAVAKDEAFFTSGTPIDGWDTSVWKFEAEKFPTLISNPEE